MNFVGSDAERPPHFVRPRHTKMRSRSTQVDPGLDAKERPALRRSKTSFHTTSWKPSTCTLEDFVHEPNLYYEETLPDSTRRRRSRHHREYTTYTGTLVDALSAIFNKELRGATIFGTPRAWMLVLFHVTLSSSLAVGYFFIPLGSAEFTLGLKDFVDVCMTGIIFLLSGYVSVMMGRWTAFRRDCLFNLHSALVNQSMYAASIWPKRTPVHREARALVARYSLLIYNLLFLEARMTDFPFGRHRNMDDAVADLVRMKLLLEPEHRALAGLPVPSGIVIGWLCRFWEEVMNKESPLECSTSFARNADPGRYSVIFRLVFQARDAITLCHTYMQTQIPYGYIHLIICLVHASCLANSIFCGIQFGILLQSASDRGSDELIAVVVPLVIVRMMRVMLVPLLLDGLICVGTVIAMPMGTDKDDFPAGAFLECLEDECLSVGAALEAWQPDAHLLTKKGGVAPDMGLAVAIKADVSKLAQAS